LIRLIFPALDYYPPEQLVARFERSWYVTAGVRKATMASYAACALVFMTVFFAVVQIVESEKTEQAEKHHVGWIER
jgi:hypothetical protein